MSKKILLLVGLIVLFMVVIGVVVFIFLGHGQNRINTDSWKTYTDEELGIKFKYNSEWGKPEKTEEAPKSEIDRETPEEAKSTGYDGPCDNLVSGKIVTINFPYFPIKIKAITKDIDGIKNCWENYLSIPGLDCGLIDGCKVPDSKQLFDCTEYYKLFYKSIKNTNPDYEYFNYHGSLFKCESVKIENKNVISSYWMGPSFNGRQEPPTDYYFYKFINLPLNKNGFTFLNASYKLKDLNNPTSEKESKTLEEKIMNNKLDSNFQEPVQQFDALIKSLEYVK